ncbi:MAG: hypothetical protein JWQ34_2487 [Mucilaginibacter sp.]|nr:hypothetical protein [Mucilaginibacter sp.]
MAIIMLSVKPINHIPSYLAVVLYILIVSGTGMFKKLFGINIYKILLELQRKLRADEVLCYTYFIVNKTVNKGIKYFFQ